MCKYVCDVHLCTYLCIVPNAKDMADTEKKIVWLRVPISPELDRALNNLQSRRTIERGGLKMSKAKVVIEVLEKAVVG